MSSARKNNAKNEEYEVLDRKVRVAELYVEGQTQWEIARELGVSQFTISTDLKKIQADWIRRLNGAWEQKKAEELAKIDHLEKIAFEAWYRSCDNVKVEVRKVEEALRMVKKDIEDRLGSRDGRKNKLPTMIEVLKPVKIVTEKKSTGQVGNQAFLAMVERCIELRCKIFGFLQDVNINIGANNQKSNTMNWGPESFAPPIGDSPIVDVTNLPVEQLPIPANQDIIDVSPTQQSPAALPSSSFSSSSDPAFEELS